MKGGVRATSTVRGLPRVRPFRYVGELGILESMKYVALLRGINVGGRRRVSMSELRELFVELGYVDVVTYINSGNVIFNASSTPHDTIVEKALAEKFGCSIDVLILSGSDIIAIADAMPTEWQNDYSDHKSDVCYLFPDIDDASIIDRVGYRPEIETLLYVNHALLSNLPRKNQPKSSLKRLIGTPLYRKMTVRNATTARKLAELVRG